MEKDFTVDIENIRTMNEEASPNLVSSAELESASPAKGCIGSLGVNCPVNCERGDNMGCKVENGNNGSCSPDNMQVLIEINKNVEEVVDADSLEKKVKKDRRKSTSAKKHPKPPRPPRGLSLDAADQKLIKELAELAMIKRARIERMKALKKMKAGKGSSIPSSYGGNFLAMLLTVLFCVVIVCQGMSSRMNSAVNFNNSSVSPEPVENSFIAVEKRLSLSHNDSKSTPPGSSR